MTDERVLDVTGDEPELVIDPSDGDQGVDDDIERMARERAEIERELEAREEKLESIGEFSHARCTEFERIEHNAYGRTIPKLRFTFQFPDGRPATRTFDYKDEPRSVDKFLKAHGAESVTDMIGTKHACIRTDSGWKLHDRQSVRSWAYYQHVFEDGSLINFHWPSFILSGVILATSILVKNPSTPDLELAQGIITVLATTAMLAYTMWRSDYYV